MKHKKNSNSNGSSVTIRFLEIVDMFHRYYMPNDACSGFGNVNYTIV